MAVFEEVGKTLSHYHSAPWLLRYTLLQAKLLFFLQVSFLSQPKYRIPMYTFYLLGTLLINIKQAKRTYTVYYTNKNHEKCTGTVTIRTHKYISGCIQNMFKIGDISLTNFDKFTLFFCFWFTSFLITVHFLLSEHTLPCSC
jgi:hypothetical protein